MKVIGWGLGAGLAGLILAALGWGLLHPADRPPPSLVGRQAPELVVQGLDGAQIRLSELRGSPVVLNFWASWCAPCRQEDPALQAAARANPGVRFLGVDIQDSDAGARAYESSARHPYPVGPAVSGSYRDYGVLAPPATFFIEAGGRVVARFVGPLDPATLDRYLKMIIQ